MEIRETLQKERVGELRESLLQKQHQAKTTPYWRGIEGEHKVSPARLPIEKALGEYSLP